MSEPRFRAKRWQLEHVHAWNEWIAGSSTTRIRRASLLADAVLNLTCRWTGSADDAQGVVLNLPTTLGRCNELEFSSDSETLAYTIWHLVDRYSRVVHALDELLRRGDLPIRRTRLAALEIGAGPLPALHAIRDFYLDLAGWAESMAGCPTVMPATHLLSLDRGRAWPHLIHGVAEELFILDPSTPPHSFAIDYTELRSFSVKGEHRKAINRITRAIVAEAEEWDEYVELSTARTEAELSHSYPPGAMDLVVLCNFVTESTMTAAFKDELIDLATCLTPGGLLLVLGSASIAYEPIFRDLSSLFSQSGGLRGVLDITQDAPHADPRLHSVVSDQLVNCLIRCRSTAPATYEDVVPALPLDVRDPGASPIGFPQFRAVAFKREGRFSTNHQTSLLRPTD